MNDDNLDPWSLHIKQSQDRWDAHVLESNRRANELTETLDNAIAGLVAEMAGVRRIVESFANKNAQVRAALQVSANNPGPLDVTATNRNLYALSATEASAAIESLSIWKAKPTLVVGFVGTLIALAVSFGLPITKEQTGAILAAVFAGLAVVASARGQRTTAALVRAGERRGALAGPESMR